MPGAHNASPSGLGQNKEKYKLNGKNCLNDSKNIATLSGLKGKVNDSIPKGWNDYRFCKTLRM